MKRPFFVWAVTLCAAAAPGVLKADPSWIIKPPASDSGRMQVFTSHSADTQRPFTVRYVAPADKKSFRRMIFGDPQNDCACAGINEHGLTVLFFKADATRDTPSKPTGKQRLYTGSYLVDLLLGRCKTASQASNNLRKLARSGYIAYGMVIFIVDARHPLIFEIAPRNYATRELGLLYAVYSNRWKMPGMEDSSSMMPWELYPRLQEEWVAKTGIVNARRNDRKVSIPEAIAISRTNSADIRREGIGRGPSTGNSLDGCLFELDPDYPGILSCVYTSFGPPRHTVYLPIPLGAMDALPPELANAEWAAIGCELNRNTPETAPVSRDLAVFEKYLFQEFGDIRHQAKLLLKEGKTEEARTLLRDMLRRQTRETLKFMKARIRIK